MRSLQNHGFWEETDRGPGVRVGGRGGFPESVTNAILAKQQEGVPGGGDKGVLYGKT